MFLLYINDLPANLPMGAQTMMYADDTTLPGDSENIVITKSQELLESSKEWFGSNRLLLKSQPK